MHVKICINHERLYWRGQTSVCFVAVFRNGVVRELSQPLENCTTRFFNIGVTPRLWTNINNDIFSELIKNRISESVNGERFCESSGHHPEIWGTLPDCYSRCIKKKYGESMTCRPDKVLTADFVHGLRCIPEMMTETSSKARVARRWFERGAEVEAVQFMSESFTYVKAYFMGRCSRWLKRQPGESVYTPWKVSRVRISVAPALLTVYNGFGLGNSWLGAPDS